jgi:hypothetical protein
LNQRAAVVLMQPELHRPWVSQAASTPAEAPVLRRAVPGEASAGIGRYAMKPFHRSRLLVAKAGKPYAEAEAFAKGQR